MALPLIPAIAAGGAKLMGAIKGLGALKGGTALAGATGSKLAAGWGTKAAAGKALASGSKLKGLTGSGLWKAGEGGRMAGKIFGYTPGELAGRLWLDAGFSGLTMATTPGDLGDKLAAGGTQFLLGGGTGLAAGKAASMLGAGPGIVNGVDMLGSVAGDFMSVPVSDTIQRGKDRLFGGEGLTAFERYQKEQDEQFRSQVQSETLASLGLIPGSRSEYLI